MSSTGVNHIQGHLPGLALKVNWDTMVEVWLVMFLIVTVSWVITRNLQKQKIGGSQFMLESIYDVWESQVKTQIQWKPNKFLPLVGSIFLFALFGYWFGLMPWKLGWLLGGKWPVLDSGHLFEGAAPTSDINITLGLAIIAVASYLFTGTASSKLSYWLPYFGMSSHHGKVSLNLTGLIEWLDLVIRPLTLCLRLFANTFAGEALMATLIKLCPFILPLLGLGFEVGVGILQAFIFAMLTTVYIAVASSHGSEEGHENVELSASTH